MSILKLKTIYLLKEKSREKVENVTLSTDEQNVTNLLQQYGRNLFVTYTTVHKIGVNPQSHFETPLGVYCYQVDSFDMEQIIEGSMPYTGSDEWKYAFFFTIDPGSKIVNVNNSGESDFEQEAKKSVSSYLVQDDATRVWADEAKYDTYFSKFWNVTRNLAHGNIANWNKLLRNNGIDIVVDYGSGTIHPNEPIQAVVLNPVIIKPVYKIVSRSEKTLEIAGRDVRNIVNMSTRKKEGIQTTNDEKLLIAASRYPKEHIRKYVAQNENTPPNILKRLLNDKSKTVKLAAMENPKTPSEDLFNLAKTVADGKFGLDTINFAYSLLINHRLTFPMLITLAKSNEIMKNNGYVFEYRLRAMLNEMSPEDLEEVFNTNPELLKSVISKIDNRYLLEKIIKETNNNVIKIFVLSNPNCPTNIVTSFLNDHDDDVRSAANNSYKNKK